MKRGGEMDEEQQEAREAVKRIKESVCVCTDECVFYREMCVKEKIKRE